MVHFALDLGSGFQSVSLKFNEHFLFHKVREFIGHIVILFFKDNMIVSEFFEVKVEFFLFLLDSLVVHFIEISLLE